MNIMDLFYNSEPWVCDVFAQTAPSSSFIISLNSDPLSYSTGIEWYTVSAISNSFAANLMLPVHLGPNDIPVAHAHAHLPFATPLVMPGCEHNQLIDDPYQRTYQNISMWLEGRIDTDKDGLLDVEERLVYFTDPYESDSDNDGYSDSTEIFTYGTNPNAWSTDGDILSDWQELNWGYDPFDTDDPIEAEYLTYSAWECHGAGYVRANYYETMDHIEVYVKYKTSYGSWTGYYYVGTDDTPTYYGDYYVSWTYLSGYVQMCVVVKAYDEANHYLGSDQQYVSLPGDGGGPPPI
jgi:hypothetical protein